MLGVSPAGCQRCPGEDKGRGVHKGGRSRAGDGTLRRRSRMRGRVKGCREPGDQGVDVAQAKTRGEGVHKGWAR